VDRVQGCVDIVEVYLALGLEFVDVIQEAECECGAWVFQCCRKPPHMKKLNTRRRLRSRLPTVAVVDANDCDTRNVKEDEINSDGGCRTTFTNAMAKLIRGTKIKHRGPGKKTRLSISGRYPVGLGIIGVKTRTSPQYCVVDLIGGPSQCNSGRACAWRNSQGSGRQHLVLSTIHKAGDWVAL